jgi:ribonuclease HI
VATVVDQIADAFEWPRSRPVRVLVGERAQRIARCVVCPSESALAGISSDDDSAVLCAVPLDAAIGRTGRRSYDPFTAVGDDVAEWRRSERAVLDVALILSGGAGGVDERLAARCGLEPVTGFSQLRPMRPVLRDVHKFVAYVPTDSLEKIRDAVFAAGAGSIGDYDRCSWSTSGTGTFRGGDGTNPAVGERGEFEQVEEIRFETVVPAHLIPQVIDAYVAAHPYEEPAFDVFETRMPSRVGFGRLGVVGPGGGQQLWNELGAIDPELVVYGRPDAVRAGACAVLHTGALRDVLDLVVARDDLALIVASSASEAEIDLMQERDIPLVLVDRSRAVEACAEDLAGLLSRALTLPVTVAGSLHFPEAAPSDGPSASASAPAAASSGSATGTDFATGTWRLHFDGGSRGNPGPAAYGWVLYDPDGNESLADGVKIGRTTNNVAEWTGLLRGLEQAAQLGIRKLHVRGDSELIVKQATGVYKVKNAALQPLAAEVKTLVGLFDHVDIKHVYRADNARADEVANEAMDGLR